MKLGKELLTAAIAILVLTVVLGVAYPLVMTGISQVAFPTKADGSQVKVDGKVVGSRLIGKAFVIDTGKKDSDGNAITRPDPQVLPAAAVADGLQRHRHLLLQPRAELGRRRASSSATQLDAYLALERRYDPRPDQGQGARRRGDHLGVRRRPAHLARPTPRIQAHRIAAVRRLPLDRVDKLIADNTDGRFLGVIGEPGVNVLELNLALDKEAPAR